MTTKKTTEPKNRRAPVRALALEPEARERLEGPIDPDNLDEALEGLDADQITGPGGLITQLAGRVIEAALAAELTWLYAYDSVGNVTYATDPRGSAGQAPGDPAPPTYTTKLTYDGFDRLVSERVPKDSANGPYYSSGSLEIRTLASGTEEGYSYATDGRLTRMGRRGRADQLRPQRLRRHPEGAHASGEPSQRRPISSCVRSSLARDALDRQNAGRKPTSIGKCFTLRVSSGTPASSAVAAIR